MDSGKKITLFLFFLLSSTFTYATNNLPKIKTIPGGIAAVPLYFPIKEAPIAYYGDNRVMVIENGPKEKTPWLAIVGIPLKSRPGKSVVEIRTPENRKITFKIKQKKYRIQKIKIRDKAKVEPLPTDKERIAKETEEIKKYLQHWSTSNPFKEAFMAPVHGRISSKFGLHRYINGKPKAPHSGIDIAAKKGTVIKAPASAVVLGASDYFYTGKTVFLDHGLGLITIYSHMDTITVKPHQHVAQGKEIGTVGKTGRVTGAHLHWSVVLNNVKVDPLLFVSSRQIKQKQKI